MVKEKQRGRLEAVKALLLGSQKGRGEISRGGVNKVSETTGEKRKKWSDLGK